MENVQATPLEQYGIFKGDPEASGCDGSHPEGWAFRQLGNEEVGITCVAMEPGIKSAWHKHPNGAHVVLCIAGKALLQIEGEDVIELPAGARASVDAGVVHWHGAAPDSRTQMLLVHACPNGLGHEHIGPVE